MTQSESEEQITVSLTKAEAATLLETFYWEWVPLERRAEIDAILQKVEKGLRLTETGG